MYFHIGFGWLIPVIPLVLVNLSFAFTSFIIYHYTSRILQREVLAAIMQNPLCPPAYISRALDSFSGKYVNPIYLEHTEAKLTSRSDLPGFLLEMQSGLPNPSALSCGASQHSPRMLPQADILYVTLKEVQCRDLPDLFSEGKHF